MKEIWQRIASIASSNLGLGILAFVIAVGLWIAGHRDIERAIEVPIEFRNIPADLMVVDNRVDYVILRLSGPRTLISTLDSKELRLWLDLGGAKSGSSSFPLDPNSFNIPRGVTVARITPPVVHLRLDPVIKRVLPVSARLSGKPSPGYKVKETVVEPETVSVHGPADEMRRMAAVETLPIDIDESRAPVKRKVRLSSDGKPLSFMPEYVTVVVSIVEELFTRDFDNLTIAARGASGEFSFAPKTVDLRLSGPRRAMEKLELGEEQVYLDLQGLAPGLHSVELTLDLPSDVNVVEQKPDRFKVKISKFKSQ